MIDTHRAAEQVLSDFAYLTEKLSDDELRKFLLIKLVPEAKALLTRPEPQNQKLYVFLQQRPRDKQPFPLVYVDQQLAEAAPHRVTPVVAVDVPMLPSPPAASDREKA